MPKATPIYIDLLDFLARTPDEGDVSPRRSEAPI